MSTAGRGAATPTSLLSLPYDVHLSILHRLTPTQLALFSQLSRATHALSSHPSLWAAHALRHFAHVPRHPSPAAVSALARALVSRWWLVVGAFVPAVPVHFRRNCAAVRARGGVHRVLADAGDSAYVIGPKYDHEAVPATRPGLGMDFFLEVHGPFPMAGMTLRVLYAVEGELGTVAGLPRGMRTGDGWVGFTVRLNGEVLEEMRLQVTDRFETVEVHIDPARLRTKPRMNSVDIDCDRTSTAAIWIREVLVAPVVLPMPKVPDEARVFEVAEEKRRLRGSPPITELPRVVEETVTPASSPAASPPGTREASPRAARGRVPRSPRRVGRLVERQSVGCVYGNDLGGGGRVKFYPHKFHAKGNKPHMYGYGNHSRSPRGNAPHSPKAKGR